ncbi:DNA transfer protein [Pseudomonas sp. SWRI102]|uniref:DNA transfer protein n=1 Tax=Pseudomonas marvdashtae TaxID=2745500 RepID=A0A923FM51_9PSED|nr:hypothetical protein [Pseudomonas marvdashtae]MBV4553057.1 DNA transfer protein [Pseudomonas marvdashtae]
MAMNPFAVDAGNDLSPGLSGLSATLANVRQGRVVEAERQRQIAAEEAQKERMAAATSAAQQAFKNGDPEEMAQVSLQYPEIGDNLRKTIGLDDERKNKEAGEFARRLLTATPEQRASIYEERINSLQEQGRDPSNTLRSYQDYQKNPNGELQAMETVWAAVDPKGYTVIANEHKAKQRAALEQQKMEREDMRFERAEAGRNQRAAARAAREGAGGMTKPTAGMQDYQFYQQLKRDNPEGALEFGRQRGFVSKEGQELSVNMQKRLSDAGDQALQSEGNAARYGELASQVDQSNIRGGLLGNWQETLKETTGDQDAVSNLRQRFNAIKASQVVSNLPPGAASDMDIKLALSGFPTDKANKQQISGFLRGLAKLEQRSAEYNNFKSDWITDNGSERGMLQAWKEQTKGGAKAKAAPAAASSDGWEIVE